MQKPMAAARQEADDGLAETIMLFPAAADMIRFSGSRVTCLPAASGMPEFGRAGTYLKTISEKDDTGRIARTLSEEKFALKCTDQQIVDIALCAALRWFAARFYDATGPDPSRHSWTGPPHSATLRRSDPSCSQDVPHAGVSNGPDT